MVPSLRLQTMPLIGLGMLLALTLRAADESAYPPGISSPPYPYLALTKGDAGTVVVDVVFDHSGHVASCKVVDSNASNLLQKSTTAFIALNWQSHKAAGKTYRVPIVYSTMRAEVSSAMTPPNFLSAGEPGVTMRLRVIFGSNGFPSDVQFIKPSGIKSVDEKTSKWIKTHWRTMAYAGESVEVPISFEPIEAKDR